MKNNIYDLVQELRSLLILGGEKDLVDLKYEAETLNECANRRLNKLLDNGIFECEGAKEFDGLYKKLQRAYPIEPCCYNRHPEFYLAEELDFGFNYEDVELKSLDKNELRHMQQEVTAFISKRSICDPNEDDPEFADILIKQKPIIYLQQDDIMEIATGLQNITHSFIQYIECYRPKHWRWGVDVINLSQYLFELMVEITYKTINGDNLDDLTYDIRQAFTYHQADVPIWLEKVINESVDSLENLLFDTIVFIDKHDYHKYEYEAWLRPIFYNIGLIGMKFTLEQEPQNDKL